MTPVPGGQPVVDVCPVTTAVWADWTELEPVVFVAVTVTRIVLSLSALTSVYVFWVAFGIGVHAPPDASQRDHAYANVMPVPVHVPSFAVSVWPTTAEPTIVGGAVFGGPAWPLTTAVALDAARTPPAGVAGSVFLAVTRTRRVEPTSPAATMYGVVEAPARAAQFPPFACPPSAGQRTH